MHEVASFSLLVIQIPSLWSQQTSPAKTDRTQPLPGALELMERAVI